MTDPTNPSIGAGIQPMTYEVGLHPQDGLIVRFTGMFHASGALPLINEWETHLAACVNCPKITFDFSGVTKIAGTARHLLTTLRNRAIALNEAFQIRLTGITDALRASLAQLGLAELFTIEEMQAAA